MTSLSVMRLGYSCFAARKPLTKSFLSLYCLRFAIRSMNCSTAKPAATAKSSNL